MLSADLTDQQERRAHRSIGLPVGDEETAASERRFGDGLTHGSPVSSNRWERCQSTTRATIKSALCGGKMEEREAESNAGNA
jgi:hypothetical protein